MDCWRVLGIEKTTDKDVVKKAYYDQLPHCHPEDDPAGFQKLKAAFDEAMAYEEAAETPRDAGSQEEDTSEVGIWMLKIRSVYGDFSERMKTAVWVELLNDPVVVSLATNREAHQQLLMFLLDNYHLPYKVFALLETTFNWKTNRKELTETFAEGFVDFLLNQADSEGLRYGLFTYEAGKDYDRFIDQYYTLRNHLTPPVDLEKSRELIQEMDQLGIAHPDYTLQKIKGYLYEDKLELCQELIDALLTGYPDGRTYFVAAHIAYSHNRFETAVSYLEQCLASEGTEYSYLANLMIADCLIGREEYDEALKKCEALKKEYPASYDLSHRIHFIHVKLAEKLKDPLPEDDEGKLEYVSHCVESDSYDCEEAAASIDPSRVDRLRYCRVMGKLSGGLKKLADAIRYFDEALELTKAAQPEEETGNHRALCEMYWEYGGMYFDNDRFDKVMEYCDRAIEADSDFMPAYYRKAAALNKIKGYREALLLCDYVLERSLYVSALYFKAEALLGLEDYEEALAAAEATISMVPYQGTFLIKLKCLLELERYDEINTLMEWLRGEEAISLEMLELHARALVASAKIPEAEKVVDEILDKEPGNAAALIQRSEIFSRNGNYQDALAALKQIGEEKRYLYDVVSAYCDVYKEMGSYDQARQVFINFLEHHTEGGVEEEKAFFRLAFLAEQETEKGGEEEKARGKLAAVLHFKDLLKSNPTHHLANKEIAERYYELQQYESALPYAVRQVALSEEGARKVAAGTGSPQAANEAEYLYYNSVICLVVVYDAMGRRGNSEVKKVLDKALERYPYDEEIHNTLGEWYAENKDYEQAYPFFKSALEYGHNHAVFWANYIRALLVLGKDEEGSEMAVRAAEAYPDEPYFLLWQAGFYQSAGKYQEALSLYLRWGEHASDSQKKNESLMRAGNCCALMKEYPQALTYYHKAAEGFGKERAEARSEAAFNEATVYLKMGYVYEILKDDTSARQSYQKALSIGRRKDDALYKLAKMYRRRGQEHRSRRAAAQMEKYIRRQGAEGDYHLLGKLYRMKGDLSRAIECFREEAERKEFCTETGKCGCSESYYELAEIYREMGQEEEARRCEEAAGKISRRRFDCGEGEFELLRI